MRILITGGCGFIGVNLIKYLDTYGFKVKILDDLSVGRKENLSLLKLKQVPELIVGDIRDKDSVGRAIEGVGAVIHLAAHTSVVDSLQDPEYDFSVNAQGTLNLLEACRQKGIRRFVFASSNAVVGEQPPPINENMIPRPLSPYGASKLTGEALCSCYHESYGLETVILRFANCYGPFSLHKTSVIAKFMERIKKGEPLIVYGDGEQTRDFIHVQDICQMIYKVLLAEPGKVAGQIFQVATGVENSINDLITDLRRVTGKELKIIYEPERRGEIRRNFADISKARKVLGFEPQVDLMEGLSQVWEWYLNAKDDYR